MESTTIGAERFCLVLGSARTAIEDIQAAKDLVRYEGLVVCNDMIARWPGPVTAAVSLHAEKMAEWLRRRKGAGHPVPARVFVPDRAAARYPAGEATGSLLPGQSNSGSSGLFAVKVALVDLGFDKAVCAGIPMTLTAHLGDREPWSGAERHRAGWKEAEVFLRRRVRSMSGWTKMLLGAPDTDWIG